MKIKKQGIQNNTQRYFCNECYKTFILKSKLDPIKIWIDYTSGKQTYQQLAVKYQCSVSTIQRYIDKAPKTALKPYSNNVIPHYFVRTEKEFTINLR
ncbi:IS1/IS1595 family N-terminal zinc-binding domain-containing protein [Actinobacillus minor]|uniref:IS1/IS1595 family N-terminal zinc-binding domain-containing protein n=1 Tax=Actinobacillus minor TaxID=51047 RepID=UPI003C6C0199